LKQLGGDNSRSATIDAVSTPSRRSQAAYHSKSQQQQQQQQQQQPDVGETQTQIRSICKPEIDPRNRNADTDLRGVQITI